jgi:CubicO group peptidase (beta-lactamase class C family)
MQEMLFDPLEMTQTTYSPLKAMTFPLALPHSKNGDGSFTISHQFYDNTANYPSWYAFSSIKDLCKFVMMHLQEGNYKGRQIIQTSSIREMRNQQCKWYTVTDAGCGITFLGIWAYQLHKIKGIITLEFGYAWRFPKLNKKA